MSLPLESTKDPCLVNISELMLLLSADTLGATINDVRNKESTQKVIAKTITVESVLTCLPLVILFRKLVQGYVDSEYAPLFEVLKMDTKSMLIFSISLFVDINYLQDRKSTRLNSSHMSISYAVFCLKKK